MGDYAHVNCSLDFERTGRKDGGSKGQFWFARNAMLPEAYDAVQINNKALWDMDRPLEESCKLELLDFEHPEGAPGEAMRGQSG